jgi:hypothetical protein
MSNSIMIAAMLGVPVTAVRLNLAPSAGGVLSEMAILQ